MCVQIQGVQFVYFALFVYSHVHVFTCVCVQCHWTSRERVYLFVICEVSHSSGRSERGLSGEEEQDAGCTVCWVWREQSLREARQEFRHGL